LNESLVLLLAGVAGGGGSGCVLAASAGLGGGVFTLSPQPVNAAPQTNTTAETKSARTVSPPGCVRLLNL
jgi:hypothetical protein